MQTIRLENAEGPADDRRRRRVLAIVGDTQVGLWVTRSLGRGGLKVFCLCASRRGLAAHSRYIRRRVDHCRAA